MKYKAYFYEQEGLTFFHFEKPSIADVIAVPFVFDGKAEARHIKDYAPLYEKFLMENKNKKEIETEMVEAAQSHYQDLAKDELV
jgi:hypothetical protein